MKRVIPSFRSLLLPGPGREFKPEFNPRFPQQLLTLLLDTSSSMHGDSIGQVNRKLTELPDEFF